MSTTGSGAKVSLMDETTPFDQDYFAPNENHVGFWGQELLYFIVALLALLVLSAWVATFGIHWQEMALVPGIMYLWVQAVKAWKGR